VGYKVKMEIDWSDWEKVYVSETHTDYVSSNGVYKITVQIFKDLDISCIAINDQNNKFVVDLDIYDVKKDRKEKVLYAHACFLRKFWLEEK
jgi:hypothetical protein